MALITNFFKKSGSWQRCQVKAEYYYTSKLLGVGEEHLILEISTPDGKTSILEIPASEATKLIEQINSKKTKESQKSNSWAERVLNYAK
jgi:hypothetical protein